MKYVIIGVQSTGLSLAHALAVNNYEVDIIERDSQLGGSWNSQWKDGKYFSENSPRVIGYSYNLQNFLRHWNVMKIYLIYMVISYKQTKK